MKRERGVGTREGWPRRNRQWARIPNHKADGRLADRTVVSIPRSPFPVPVSQSGYTLIEVIVAFGVLALGLTLLLGTLSGATRQVRQADVSTRASLHAQSLLDQAGIGESLQPGQTDGALEDGFYRWTMDVAPYRDPGAPPPGPESLAEPQLMQLVLTIRWGDAPRDVLQLTTLRLVSPDPLAGMGAGR